MTRGRLDDPAVDATLRAAAPWQATRVPRRGLAVSVTRADLRQKVRVRRAGSSILFVVDASGSMRICQRMVEAKTAVLSLLADAYRMRDRVGLVAFRGQGAELVLPLTGSIELARRSLLVLPSGGRTPLGEGLRLGREVLEREHVRRPDMLGLMMVLSDGKANAAPTGEPVAHALAQARAVRRSGIPLVFLDTDATWEDPGLGMKVCDLAGGTYLGIGELSARGILDVVEATLPDR
jgi:magnesium chelatase subunit D